MRGGGIQAGQRDSRSVAHDFDILFSTLRCTAISDLNGLNMSKTALEKILCDVFQVR